MVVDTLFFYCGSNDLRHGPSTLDQFSQAPSYIGHMEVSCRDRSRSCAQPQVLHISYVPMSETDGVCSPSLGTL